MCIIYIYRYVYIYIYICIYIYMYIHRGCSQKEPQNDGFSVGSRQTPPKRGLPFKRNMCMCAPNKIWRPQNGWFLCGSLSQPTFGCSHVQNHMFHDTNIQPRSMFIVYWAPSPQINMETPFAEETLGIRSILASVPISYPSQNSIY